MYVECFGGKLLQKGREADDDDGDDDDHEREAKK